uniref:WSC domain-containing protein n=1 Tax=Macrostomum lignano TaxID=282301 RepID=A0A1I8JBX5_9PLAT
KGWWTAKTQKLAHIKEIKIFNRVDCCSNRLTNFVVTVDGHVCASYNSRSVFKVKTFKCNKVGRVVMIRSRKRTYLTLCEVQVFGTRAIDGNTNQHYWGHSCTHTKLQKGWWTAKTQKLAHIKEIKIFNRVDCCSNRLTNFVVTVDGHVCASYNSRSVFKVKTFKCNKVGRVVMIRSRKRTYLTLCEVQVFGKYFKRRPKFEYLGCFYDSEEYPDFFIKAASNSKMTQRKCNRFCKSRGTTYFAVQSGNRCFCGENYGNNGEAEDGDCNVPCSGDSGIKCGGKMRNAVFELSFNTCFQTSTGWNGVCKRAMDGNKNQDYGKHSCTHTKAPGGFWQGSFTRPAHIKEVVIYNRLDCCSNLLNNFDIIVDGQVCARHRSSTFFSVKRFKCDKVGQNVIIRTNLKKYLTLCEVEVFGEYTKLAAKRSDMLPLSHCSQSSVGWSGVCSRAIDGNTNQNYWGHSCTHTKLESGWWMAKTQKLAHIKEIKIFNRLDCCFDRLTNFVVTVDGHVCGSYHSHSVFKVTTFRCNRVGRVVMIRSRKRTYLTLCEVQVFGSYTKRSTGNKLSFNTCFQTSTGWNGVCKRAMDGNKNQDYGKHSCTHTKAPGGFWQGSFTRPAHIKEVVIYNRLDCCSNLLNNFDIIVDGQVCARHRSSTFFSVKRFKCDKVGQNVIIRNNLKKWFTLCEVEVFGEYTKLAAKRSDILPLSRCSQSSVGWNGVCSKAIDGNTNQNYWGHSCTHTKLESGWWMAKTQKLAHIKEIKIFNRLDCCFDRLTNFVVT